MRYVMKQKFFALGDDFSIKDENEQDRFFVDGKMFSLVKTFDIKDMDKNVVAQIKQKLFSLGTTFNIYRNGEVAATVKKPWFSFFKTTFNITVLGSESIDVEGNFFQKEYKFTRGGQTIANVSKSYFSWTDTYGVDIAEGEDDVLVLCVAVVIDTVCHEKK